MELGAVKVPLVRRIRLALEEAGSGLRSAAVEDAGGLVARLERLRRAFPGDRGLLDRVSLSGHVLDLLEGAPVGGGVVR